MEYQSQLSAKRFEFSERDQEEVTNVTRSPR
jgi:hypothetical protein